MARATEMCILVLFDTARSAASRDVIQAVAAATTISSRTPEQQREYGENCQRVVTSFLMQLFNYLQLLQLYHLT